ncbi:hypothetical protein [uncultured Vagococcus sp.]|uniref:hypothetical protein n=1 Tax=uncultured Vagococcus sp. TaxID=189676 RepID=UPI0028D057B0|nr:hypothetical protein [uncultured Vagococcus sp.]
MDTPGLKIYSYSDAPTKKLLIVIEVLFGKQLDGKQVLYNEIEQIDLVCHKRQRLSPFDSNPDYLCIRLGVDGEKVDLPLSRDFVSYLPQAVSYFEKKGVLVEDKANLIQAILEGKALFAYMNKGFINYSL